MDHLLSIQTEGIQQDQKDSYHNHRYEPTPYWVLEELFNQYPLSKEDCFIDYGCGKGRLNFYVEYRFHCKSKGIEYNREYYEDALSNNSTYIGAHRNHISFYHMPAQNYPVAQEDTVFYFFNPFSSEIFMSTLAQIQDSLLAFPRKITIILYYPDYEYTYYLDTYTEFHLIDQIDVQTRHMDVRECFKIYQNR